ncbi:hypothetical protein M885DRAFT_530101 [Pelagophyceae sp. CCMP2097]|nr:hypothetical protein M885DRAFT_530101 [Pelagophyceae sp. CCMP2097]
MPDARDLGDAALESLARSGRGLFQPRDGRRLANKLAPQLATTQMAALLNLPKGLKFLAKFATLLPATAAGGGLVEAAAAHTWPAAQASAFREHDLRLAGVLSQLCALLPLTSLIAADKALIDRPEATYDDWAALASAVQSNGDDDAELRLETDTNDEVARRWLRQRAAAE